MRQISFVAGYYEWKLLIDDKLVYIFGDSDNENFNTKKELHAYIDMVLEAIDDEAKDKGNDYYGFGFCGYYGNDYKQEVKELWLSLTKQERTLVKKTMFSKWERYVDQI